MKRLQLLAIAVVAIAAASVRADILSGPTVGDAVKELKVFGVVGPVEGKDADFTKERKDAPTIYAFVQKEHWSRPMAKMLKTLDPLVKEADDKAQVVGVFLRPTPAPKNRLGDRDQRIL